MKYVLALGIALALNAVANVLMKVGMNSVAVSGGLLKHGLAAAGKTVLTTTPLVVGLLCFALNAGFYMYALQSRALKISIAYPVMVGGGFALIAVMARVHPALRERLSLGQVCGVVLVLAGIVLIALQTETASA